MELRIRIGEVAARVGRGDTYTGILDALIERRYSSAKLEQIRIRNQG